MTKVQEVREHYERHPYPSYPWYARGRWTDLDRIDFATWRVKRGVRDAWIVGCGTLAPLMFGRRNPAVKFLATDLSKRSLNRAWWRLLLFGIWNVKLQQEDLLESEYRECFDAVDAYGVLHHLPQPERGLKRIAEALRPQGVLRVMLYSRSGRSPYEELRAELRKEDIWTVKQARAYLRDRGVSLEGELATSAGVADALLHPLVWTYTQEDIEALVAAVPELQLRSVEEKGNFVVSCERRA